MSVHVWASLNTFVDIKYNVLYLAICYDDITKMKDRDWMLYLDLFVMLTSLKSKVVIG